MTRDASAATASMRGDAIVETVVKLGGGVLAHAEHFDAVLTTIATASRERRLLVVPGGGPFADAVREVDRKLGLGDDAAHWMAVLAMDQYAHLVAARLTAACSSRNREKSKPRSARVPSAGFPCRAISPAARDRPAPA
jgi:aspartokinase-like uncharacterized kinase